MLLVGALGFVLGLIFFGGLWWTIRRMLHSPRPALWMLGSLVLRMGIVLTGFWLIAGHDWKRMLVCLAGFFIARLVLTRPSRVQHRQTIDVTKQDRREPQP
ncbi:MAG: ATP synthase subunit I [Dokdonella sp.]